MVPHKDRGGELTCTMRVTTNAVRKKKGNRGSRKRLQDKCDSGFMSTLNEPHAHTRLPKKKTKAPHFGHPEEVLNRTQRRK